MLFCSLNEADTKLSTVRYYLGDFTGSKFLYQDSPCHLMDLGPDFGSMNMIGETEGKNLCVGWLGNDAYAQIGYSEFYRGQMALCRELSLVKEIEGWTLLQNPVTEIESLFNKKKEVTEINELSSLFNASNGTCELLIENVSAFHLYLSNDKNEIVTLYLKDDCIGIDRSKSGFLPEGMQEKHEAKLQSNAPHSMRVFIDRNSVEVFADGGKVCYSALMFPSEPFQSMKLDGEVHKVKFCSL